MKSRFVKGPIGGFLGSNGGGGAPEAGAGDQIEIMTQGADSNLFVPVGDSTSVKGITEFWTGELP